MNERREDTRITILRNGQACTLTLEQFLNSAHYDLGHGEPVWFKSSYHYDKSKMFIGEMDGKPGMYDLCGNICPLTGTPFYINAGLHEFSYQV